MSTETKTGETPKAESVTAPVDTTPEAPKAPKAPKKSKRQKRNLLPVKRADFDLQRLETITGEVKGAKIIRMGQKYKRKVKGVEVEVTSKAFTMTLPKASELTGTDDEKAVEIEKIGDAISKVNLKATHAVSDDARYHGTGIKLTQTGALHMVWKPKKAVDDLLKASAITGIPYSVLAREQKRQREKNVAINV